MTHLQRAVPEIWYRWACKACPFKGRALGDPEQLVEEIERLRAELSDVSAAADIEARRADEMQVVVGTMQAIADTLRSRCEELESSVRLAHATKQGEEIAKWKARCEELEAKLALTPDLGLVERLLDLADKALAVRALGRVECTPAQYRAAEEAYESALDAVEALSPERDAAENKTPTG